MTISRDELIDLLKEKVLIVTFKKVDGDERIMTCTLKKDVLPLYEAKEDAKPRKPNLEVVHVWDVNKSAWRSFRYDSIINIENT